MKKLIFVTLLSTFVWLGLTGCNDDCPTCPDNKPPVEKDYHFLYSFVGSFSTASVLTYSTKSGEIVDSAYYGRFPFHDARFSKDGLFVYYTIGEFGNEATWICNYATGDTLAYVSGVYGHWLQLFSDEKHLLVSGAGTYVRILALPGLGVEYERFAASGWGDGAVHPTELTSYVPNSSSDSLLVLKLANQEVEEREIAITTLDGHPARSFNAAVTLDGSILILTVDYFPVGGGGGFLQLRDAKTFQILREYSPGRGTAFLHPDGKRVFFLECSRPEVGNAGALWELSLETLLMTRVLNGDDVSSGEVHQGLNPSDMAITLMAGSGFLPAVVAGLPLARF